MRKSVPTSVFLLFSMVATVVFTTTAEAQTSATCNGLTATIVGSGGDDVLEGTDGDDVIVAFGGNDRIDSGEGDDVICGNSGDDQIWAGFGNNVVIGGEDDDTIHLSGGGLVFGRAGDVTIEVFGHSPFGDVVVNGGSGNDLSLIHI